MSETIGLAVLICGMGAIFAGLIAYSRTNNPGTAFGYFIFGAILPVIGVIAACFVKGPPQPPGWRADPWREAALRYYDGANWTYHVAAMPEPASPVEQDRRADVP